MIIIYSIITLFSITKLITNVIIILYILSVKVQVWCLDVFIYFYKNLKYSAAEKCQLPLLLLLLRWNNVMLHIHCSSSFSPVASKCSIEPINTTISSPSYICTLEWKIQTARKLNWNICWKSSSFPEQITPRGCWSLRWEHFNALLTQKRIEVTVDAFFL